MTELEKPRIGTTERISGWHDDVEMEAYLGDPAVSASRLFTLHQNTPAHLLQDLRTAEVPTDAKELGSILHTKVFEPEEFDGRYVVLGQCEATVKSTGDRCSNAGSVWRDGKSFCGVKGHDPYGKDVPEAEGIHTIAAESRDLATAMEKALRSHKTASELLWCDGRREVTGWWKDRATGLWCRIRPDLLFEEPPTVPQRYHFSTSNLKSTGKSAHPDRYWRDAERMGTEFKAGFYLMGLRELCGWEPQNFFYPVVESNPPHEVIVYRLNDEALMLGELQARHALNALADCVETGRWPGYGIEIHDLKISEWRTRHLEEVDFSAVA